MALSAYFSADAKKSFTKKEEFFLKRKKYTVGLVSILFAVGLRREEAAARNTCIYVLVYEALSYFLLVYVALSYQCTGP